MTPKIILFDLDGTLSNPKIGITKSVQFALHKMGIEEENIDDLEFFIGPPLEVTFMEHYQMTQAEAKRAIDFYRERFKEKGLYENELYEGIIPLLQTLRNAGFTLAIATSKPTVFAKEIADHFQIATYFDLIVGSNLDGTRVHKAEIIQYIVDHYQNDKLTDYVMIGDRKFDIVGAQQVGMDSIGVSYGFAAKNELIEASPTYIVDNVKELQEKILSLP